LDTCSYDEVLRDPKIREILLSLDQEGRKVASRLLSELYVKRQSLTLENVLAKYGSIGQDKVRLLYSREMELLSGSG